MICTHLIRNSCYAVSYECRINRAIPLWNALLCGAKIQFSCIHTALRQNHESPDWPAFFRGMLSLVRWEFDSQRGWWNRRSESYAYADVLFELGNRMSPLQSVEYCDNRLARFVASKGKCEITGKLLSVNEVHCHHFLPRHLGGTDQYSNLRIVHVDVHRLIHATTPESIQFYLRKTGCYKKPCLDKINRWRASANLPAITL